MNRLTMDEYIKRETTVRAVMAAKWVDGSDGAMAMEIVATAPTADVAPVRHGRWDGNDCTVCKLPWNYNMVQNADDWGYFDPMPDYCPNCGAKMDGGADNACL